MYRFPLASGNLVNGVSNLDLTAAYGVLANEGKSVKPIFYTKLVDKTGNILFKNEQKSSQLLETASAWLITNVLHEYIETGAGKAADLGIEKLPAAGYGASTKGNKDQWFTGYTPYYTAGIWCGYDDSGMITSDISCETLWKQIMKQVHSTKKIEKEALKSRTISLPATSVPNAESLQLRICAIRHSVVILSAANILSAAHNRPKTVTAMSNTASAKRVENLPPRSAQIAGGRTCLSDQRRTGNHKGYSLCVDAKASQQSM